ncbi:MAG: class I SAM-dependent methyltransferase [Micromonosporaceae bacterium]|nr:class I SAM-dependent methyltransferase [Micromonosporaceae bacterium]
MGAIQLMDADFYDRDYYDGDGKSNYDEYTFESSPFANHADAIARMIEHYRLSGPVLDIGCAKGYLVYMLRQRGIEAYGVDWSEYATASASADVRPFLRCASALDLPYPDGYFGLAVSFDVLEHLDDCAARRALAEAARVSRSQLHQVNTGRLAEWLYETDSSHCLKYSLQEWTGMAAELELPNTTICEPDRRLPFLDGAVR